MAVSLKQMSTTRGERVANPGISNHKNIVKAEIGMRELLDAPVDSQHFVLAKLFRGLDEHGFVNGLARTSGNDRRFLTETRDALVNAYLLHRGEVDAFSDTFFRSRELRSADGNHSAESVLELAHMIQTDFATQYVYAQALRVGNRILDEKQSRELVSRLTGIKAEDIPFLFLEVGTEGDEPIIKNLWGRGFGKESTDDLLAYQRVADQLFSRTGILFSNEASLHIVTSPETALARMSMEEMNFAGIVTREIPLSLRDAAEVAFLLLKDETSHPESGTAADKAYHAQYRRGRVTNWEMEEARAQVRFLTAQDEEQSGWHTSSLWSTELVVGRVSQYPPRDMYDDEMAE